MASRCSARGARSGRAGRPLTANARQLKLLNEKKTCLLLTSVCVILPCRLPFFAIGLDMPIARCTGHLLNWTADGSCAPGSWREVIYLRIAQNYYENLKQKLLRKLQQTKTYIYSNSASTPTLLPSLLWTLILCDVTKIWRNKREKEKRKRKRKEKEKKKKKDIRSNFANADMNQQERRKRVGCLWIRSGPPLNFFYYYLVKEKWSKFPISP